MLETTHTPTRLEPGRLTASVEPRPRIFFGGLESLRGVAALAVAAYHITWLNATYHWGFVRNAYLMVDFFFVLSGFVICHSYGNRIRSGRDFARFVWLRLGRLYPLHLLMLVAFLSTHVAEFVKELITGNVGDSPALSHIHYYEIFTSLFLVQGLGFTRELDYNFPSWSISTELYTCVVFGLMIWHLRRWRWLAAAIASVGAFLVLLVVGEQSLSIVYTLGFVRCIGGFFLGMLTYRAYTSLRSSKLVANSGGVIDIALAASLVLFAIFLTVKKAGYSDFLLPPFVALIVLLVAARPDSMVGKALMVKPLAWLGRVSYSVYMVHWMTISIAERLLRMVTNPSVTAGAAGSDTMHAAQVLVPNHWVGTLFAILTLASVCAISQVTYTLVEDPLRRRAKRFADRYFADRP